MQLAIIPISIIGYETNGQSTSAAEASSIQLDLDEAFDVRAATPLETMLREAFQEFLVARRKETACNTWIFLGLGLLFFVGWQYRLITMTGTASATLTALQFAPACTLFCCSACNFSSDAVLMKPPVTRGQ